MVLSAAIGSASAAPGRGNGAGAGSNNATDPIMGKWEIYCTKYTLFYAVYPSFSTINPFSFDSTTNFIKYNLEKKHLQKGDWFEVLTKKLL